MLSKDEIKILKELYEECNEDYNSEPIGGGNPYYRCVDCEQSAPNISIHGHNANCSWLKRNKAALVLKKVIEGA